LDPDQVNAHNLNNVRHETTRHFGGKKWNILRAELMNLKQTIRIRISYLYRGISDFKRGYRPRTH
jgi:hypothetical protein